MKIGFIGLGIMGAPMVGRLLDGSHQVFANDLKPIQPEILEKGATQVSSAREATEMGDVIIVMVPAIWMHLYRVARWAPRRGH
jgi:2-hydroxy-3-oxopropionate reductase